MCTDEVACNGHDHLEKLYLDEVFNLNVDKVFENVFTDSPFFRVFVGSRKTFGQCFFFSASGKSNTVIFCFVFSLSFFSPHRQSSLRRCSLGICRGVLAWTASLVQWLRRPLAPGFFRGRH